MSYKVAGGLALIVGIGLSVVLLRIGSQSERLVSTEAVSEDRGSKRVITLAPSITETVFTLGLGDRVVGVTDFCTYPEEATQKERVGGWMNPNLEKITVLQPDLVIIQGQHEKVRAYCERRNIPLLSVDMDTMPGIFEGIREIAEALGCPSCGKRLSSKIRLELKEAQAAVADRPRLRVFLLLGRRPGSLTGLYTMGRGTFLTEVVEIAGGMSIFADVDQPYPQASKESLVQRAPEVILEMHPGETFTPEEIEKLKRDWSAMPSLPAVHTGRIYVMTEDFALIPGPRVGRLARRMASILHPDVAKGY